ncbi:MAG: thiamine phosphate synthase [Acidobacteria bacterium]|nr:MAG: thiamine phosphate synthase [Acidobacteriota bacterium]
MSPELPALKGRPSPSAPRNPFFLPPLYPILVPSRIGSGGLAEICGFARELVAGGTTLIQLGEKQASAKEILRLARELRRVLPAEIKLIVNDRADLAVAVQADGVHVGEDDIPPEAARQIVGPNRILGVSTHNPEQTEKASQSFVDYVAIGPVFNTTSKNNLDPVIGLEGVRRARARTQRPLVAIGGITLQNCQSVIRSGADSVAVISELLGDPRKTTADFLLKMR